MAYVPTNWADRTVERPLTFTLIDNVDGSVTLVPAEGNIISSGTPITADKLNKIESALANAIDKTGDTMQGGLSFAPDAHISSDLVVDGQVKVNSSKGLRFQNASSIMMDDWGDIAVPPDVTPSLGSSWVVYNYDGTRRLSIPIGTSSTGAYTLTPAPNGNITIGGGINNVIAPKSDGTLSLINGWTNYNTSTYEGNGYTKSADGFVTLKGLVKGTIKTVIATLPVGCRPEGRRMFACFAGVAISRVDVHPDGKVEHVTGSADYVSLSNITFQAVN
jgi:hypothetical protein